MNSSTIYSVFSRESVCNSFLVWYTDSYQITGIQISCQITGTQISCQITGIQISCQITGIQISCQITGIQIVAT